MNILKNLKLKTKLIGSFVLLALIGGTISYVVPQIFLEEMTEDSLPTLTITGQMGKLVKATQLETSQFVVTGTEDSVEQFNQYASELNVLSEQVGNLGDNPEKVAVFQNLARLTKQLLRIEQKVIQSHRQSLEQSKGLEEVEHKVEVMLDDAQQSVETKVAKSLEEDKSGKRLETLLRTQQYLNEYVGEVQIMRLETLGFVTSRDPQAREHFEATEARLEAIEKNLTAILKLDQPSEADLFIRVADLVQTIQAQGKAVFETHTQTLSSLAELEALEQELDLALGTAELLANQEISDEVAWVNGSLFISSLVALAFSVILGTFIANSLVKPIYQLADVAKQIEAGDLTVQAQINMHDEIGDLAQAFNRMTVQLRDLIGSLEDQVQERTADLTLSMGVGQRAAVIRELSELLPTITEFIREQFNLYYAQVYFVDDLEKNLILQAGTGPVGQELIARHHTLPIGPGSIVGRVAAERKSIVVADTQNSDLHKANALLPETRSELAVPLIFENRIIGVLDMQANKVNTFTEINVTVFEAMATQLAISIDSANQWALGQEAQRKSEEVVRQLTREKWTERLASRRGSLSFAYDLLTITPLAGVDPEATNGEEKLTVPLMVQNEPIGQLSVNVPSQRAFSTDERDLLTAVAQHLGQKAENLRLFEQTQQQANREYIARQIVDKVRGSRDVEMALKTAAEELSKALGASRAIIDLRVAAQPESTDSSFEQILSREQNDNE